VLERVFRGTPLTVKGMQPRRRATHTPDLSGSVFRPSTMRSLPSAPMQESCDVNYASDTQVVNGQSVTRHPALCFVGARLASPTCADVHNCFASDVLPEPGAEATGPDNRS
jgi:hypothetical protein